MPSSSSAYPQKKQFGVGHLMLCAILVCASCALLLATNGGAPAPLPSKFACSARNISNVVLTYQHLEEKEHSEAVAASKNAEMAKTEVDAAKKVAHMLAQNSMHLAEARKAVLKEQIEADQARIVEVEETEEAQKTAAVKEALSSMNAEEYHEVLLTADNNGDAKTDKDEFESEVLQRNTRKFASLWFFLGTFVFVAIAVFLQGVGYGRVFLFIMGFLWAVMLLPQYTVAETAFVRARPLPCQGITCRFSEGMVRIDSWDNMVEDLTCMMGADAPASSVAAVYLFKCTHDLRGNQATCMRERCKDMCVQPTATSQLATGRWDAHLEVRYDSNMNGTHTCNALGQCVEFAKRARCSLWRSVLTAIAHFKAELTISMIVVLLTIVGWGVRRAQGRSVGLNTVDILAHNHWMIIKVALVLLAAWHIVQGSGEHTPSIIDDYIGEVAILTALLLNLYAKEPVYQILFNTVFCVLWLVELCVNLDEVRWVPNQYVPHYGVGMLVAMCARIICLGMSHHSETLQTAKDAETINDIFAKDSTAGFDTGDIILNGGVVPGSSVMLLESLATGLLLGSPWTHPSMIIRDPSARLRLAYLAWDAIGPDFDGWAYSTNPGHLGDLFAEAMQEVAFLATCWPSSEYSDDSVDMVDEGTQLKRLPWRTDEELLDLTLTQFSQLLAHECQVISARYRTNRAAHNYALTTLAEMGKELLCEEWVSGRGVWKEDEVKQKLRDHLKAKFRDDMTVRQWYELTAASSGVYILDMRTPYATLQNMDDWQHFWMVREGNVGVFKSTPCKALKTKGEGVAFKRMGWRKLICGSDAPHRKHIKQQALRLVSSPFVEAGKALLDPTRDKFSLVRALLHTMGGVKGHSPYTKRMVQDSEPGFWCEARRLLKGAYCFEFVAHLYQGAGLLPPDEEWYQSGHYHAGTWDDITIARSVDKAMQRQTEAKLAPLQDIVADDLKQGLAEAEAEAKTEAEA